MSHPEVPLGLLHHTEWDEPLVTPYELFGDHVHYIAPNGYKGACRVATWFEDAHPIELTLDDTGSTATVTTTIEETVLEEEIELDASNPQHLREIARLLNVMCIEYGSNVAAQLRDRARHWDADRPRRDVDRLLATAKAAGIDFAPWQIDLICWMIDQPDADTLLISPPWSRR